MARVMSITLFLFSSLLVSCFQPPLHTGAPMAAHHRLAVMMAKRSAKRSKSKAKPVRSFDLQSAMVSAMYGHRDLWDKDESRQLCTDVYVRAESLSLIHI